MRRETKEVMEVTMLEGAGRGGEGMDSWAEAKLGLLLRGCSAMGGSSRVKKE